MDCDADGADGDLSPVFWDRAAGRGLLADWNMALVVLMWLLSHPAPRGGLLRGHPVDRKLRAARRVHRERTTRRHCAGTVGGGRGEGEIPDLLDSVVTSEAR